MSTTVTDCLENYSRKYIEELSSDSENTPVKIDVYKRSINVGLAPLSIITCAVDTIIGIGAGCISILPVLSVDKQRKISNLQRITLKALQDSFRYLIIIY